MLKNFVATKSYFCLTYTSNKLPNHLAWHDPNEKMLTIKWLARNTHELQILAMIKISIWINSDCNKPHAWGGNTIWTSFDQLDLYIWPLFRLRSLGCLLQVNGFNESFLMEHYLTQLEHQHAWNISGKMYLIYVNYVRLCRV